MMPKLEFPRPCGESWDDMAPVDGGRMCARCDRRLIDFRADTDDEIARAYAASDTPVCGAYSPEQVARWADPRPILVSLTLGGSLLGASAAHAAPPSAVHAEQPAARVAGQDADTLIVRGVVRDTAGAPLSGALVRLQGTGVRTMTDMAGRYSIQLPDTANPATRAHLVFTRIGYASREVEVSVAPNEPTLIDAVLAGEVIHIVGIIAVGYNRRSLWSRLTHWVRHIF